MARYYRRDFRTPTLADAWDFMGLFGIDGDSILLASDMPEQEFDGYNGL